MFLNSYGFERLSNFQLEYSRGGTFHPGHGKPMSPEVSVTLESLSELQQKRFELRQEFKVATEQAPLT